MHDVIAFLFWQKFLIDGVASSVACFDGLRFLFCLFATAFAEKDKSFVAMRIEYHFWPFEVVI